MKPAVIYLDVDETLADWVGPALRLLGHDPESSVACSAHVNPMTQRQLATALADSISPNGVRLTDILATKGASC